MLEPELAFADINDTMDCAEALVSFDIVLFFFFGGTCPALIKMTSVCVFFFFLLPPPLDGSLQVQYCCQKLLSECLDDIEFFTAMFDKECKSRLQLVAETPFKRLTYTEAINILKDKVKSKQVKFEAAVEWGM